MAWGGKTSTAGTGLQSGSITAPVTRVVNLGGETITTIQVDMQNLSASAGAAATVIGNKEGGVDNSDPAFLITWDNAVNGVCYKAEMSCLETPTGNGGAPAYDIDLMLNSSAASVQGSTASGDVLIAATEAWSIGLSKQQLDAAIVDTYSVYLTNGDTVAATGDAQYTAGKFVIKLYGYIDF